MAADEDPTLGQVVAAWGVSSVELVNPDCAQLRVGGPRLWDARDDADVGPRDVLLAVNVPPADGILAALQGTGVTAVAFKGDARCLTAEATRYGVGLLAVADELSWDRLYGLLQRVAATQGPTQEKDLFAFANALAALVEGAVAIEDHNGTLLAYSTLDQDIDEARRQTILGRGNPPHWSHLLEEEGYYRQLADASGPIRIADPEGRANDRVVTLVRAGNEVLGSVWVVSGSVPLGADAEQILDDATPQAAIHLLRLRSHSGVARRDRGSKLRAVLEGQPASGLSIDNSTIVQMAAFHVSGTDGPDLLVNRARVLDAITLACESIRRAVFCCWIGDTVYALFPEVSAATTDRLLVLADDVCVRTSRALGVEVIAGVSDPRSGPASLLECREEADRALRVLTARPTGRRVGTVDDTRTTHVLLTLGDVVRDRPDLQVPGIHELLRHDQEGGKNYLETLKAYLDAGGSIPVAAAELGVHVNTLRYRLDRVQEVAGLNLKDPKQRLVIALQLIALDW